MVQNTVEVTGEDGVTTEVEMVFEINYSSGNAGEMRDNPSLGEATVVCGNTIQNRTIESGDEITIYSNESIDFSGYVTSKPGKTNLQSPELEIEAKDKRSELKYQKVNRVFYQMDTADIIRSAIQYRAEPVSERDIFTAEGTSNWSTDLTHFSMGNVGDQSLSNRGGDFLFLGWQKGMSGRYHATYHDVPISAADDGNLEKFFTRMLVNNRGQQFKVEIELRDHDGNNYVWSLDSERSGTGNDFTKYELRPENATTDPSFRAPLSEDGTLRYHFRIDGQLPEPRAAALDYASTIPFRRSPRDTDIDVSGVETRTGSDQRIITRRFDGSIRELMQDLETEEGYASRVTADDTLQYFPSGDTVSDLRIDYNTTNVVDAKFERDYERITNKVHVQGSGNVRVTVEDDASIQFYGISAREKPITDKSIQTRNEAVDRGRGYLEKNAWQEGAITFEIADSDYQRLQVGQKINVNWPPENIQGTFLINNLETDDNGIVTVELSQ